MRRCRRCNRTDRAKAALTNYEAALAPNIALFTRRQRLDDALLLQKRREEVQKARLPTPAASAPAPAATPSPAAKQLSSQRHSRFKT
jgi:hypothetical protein